MRVSASPAYRLRTPALRTPALRTGQPKPRYITQGPAPLAVHALPDATRLRCAASFPFSELELLFAPLTTSKAHTQIGNITAQHLPRQVLAQ